MALLAVDALECEPLRLDPASPNECVGREVALIGYPARDYRSDLQVQDRVFDGIYGVKRLQPGLTLGEREFRSAGLTVATLAHDASTLGGSSGSCVVDVATGRVLGLHFAGDYLVANYAVSAHHLSRDDRVRAAGVLFSSGASESPNPWQADWDATLPAPSAIAVNGVAKAAAAADAPSPRPEPQRASEIRIVVEVEVSLRVEAQGQS
jgi:hypothetical protein